MIEILRPRMAAQTTTKDELRDAFQVKTMYSEYAHMVMVFNITIFRIAIFRIAIFRITIFRITIFKILTQIYLRNNVISLSNYSFIVILHYLHYQNLSQSSFLSSLPKYRSFNISSLANIPVIYLSCSIRRAMEKSRFKT